MIGKQKEGITARLNEALQAAGFSEERGAAQRIATAFSVSRETARKWISGEAYPELHRIAAITLKARQTQPHITTNYVLDGLRSSDEESRGASSKAAMSNISAPARGLIELISDADRSQSVSAENWRQLAGILKTMMGANAPAKPIGARMRKT